MFVRTNALHLSGRGRGMRGLRGRLGCSSCAGKSLGQDDAGIDLLSPGPLSPLAPSPDAYVPQPPMANAPAYTGIQAGAPAGQASVSTSGSSSWWSDSPPAGAASLLSLPATSSISGYLPYILGGAAFIAFIAVLKKK